ncbi:MAG TPA: hypothetical protein V6D10_17280 [Trichocoleus sp.]|jgi:hypothetical protein
MMNSIETQPITTIAPPLAKPESPQFPPDPTNPLVWILLITALLGNADEVINAITQLIQAIASLKSGNGKRSKGRSDHDS